MEPGFLSALYHDNYLDEVYGNIPKTSNIKPNGQFKEGVTALNQVPARDAFISSKHVENVAKKGLKEKAVGLLKSAKNWAKNHKVASALIAAGTLLVGGLAITSNKNKKAVSQQKNVMYSHQG